MYHEVKWRIVLKKEDCYKYAIAVQSSVKSTSHTLQPQEANAFSL